MARIFLDADVLFSAACREGAGLSSLWTLSNTEVVTSGYAAEEARRNLESDAARARLEALLRRTTIVAEAPDVALPGSPELAQKDQPILKAAIASGATHLITGDLRDFGRLLGKRTLGVLIQTPAELLRRA